MDPIEQLFENTKRLYINDPRWSFDYTFNAGRWLLTLCDGDLKAVKRYVCTNDVTKAQAVLQNMLEWKNSCLGNND